MRLFAATKLFQNLIELDFDQASLLLIGDTVISTGCKTSLASNFQVHRCR